jgi:antitoxin FitA
VLFGGSSAYPARWRATARRDLAELRNERNPDAIIATTVAQLLVRNIESEVIRELKIRAARHGRSAEAEHREILRAALRQQGSPISLKQLLLQIPNVGEDRDFERQDDRGRSLQL